MIYSNTKNKECMVSSAATITRSVIGICHYWELF